MRIGITGGAGFIGTHTVHAALNMGHEVVVFDRRSRQPMNLSGAYNETVPTFLGDVRDPVAMCELAAHVDGIIHLAACLGTQETIQNPLPATETNIQGGLNFLEACSQYKIPGVYIGVGNHWMNNTYSITKTTVERFVQMFNKERGTQVNVVRAVNAYGPGQSIAPPFGPAKVRKITPAFVCRALTGQDIEVYGDGNQVSDMVHVSDVAGVLVRSLLHAAAGNVFPEVVSVGPQDHLTVNEVAEIVIDAVEQSGLEYQRVGIQHLPMRQGEIPGAIVAADTSTLRHVNIDPADLLPARVGLFQTVQWYRENWLPGWVG